ncbi:MAG: dihydroneopterin aldolase [Actinomycetota bacterium]|nr:dihydroneopterin aldolase [Actinomycetota bacterium]
MIGVVELDRIRVEGRHGVGDEERSRVQPFEVSVRATLDIARAAVSDDIAESLDYSRLAALVVEIVEGESFHLLEALCWRIATAAQERFDVPRIWVKVAKLHPPMPVRLAHAAVEVEIEGRSTR